MIFRNIGFDIKLSDRWPNEDFPPLFTFETLENKWSPSCSVYCSFLKNKMFVRFNYIIDVWNRICSTMRIIPVLGAIFKLTAILTNFHDHCLTWMLQWRIRVIDEETTIVATLCHTTIPLIWIQFLFFFPSPRIEGLNNAYQFQHLTFPIFACIIWFYRAKIVIKIAIWRTFERYVIFIQPIGDASRSVIPTVVTNLIFHNTFPSI